MQLIRFRAGALTLALIVGTACGTSAKATKSAVEPELTEEQTTVITAGSTSSGDRPLQAKPQVNVPDSPPPAELQSRDLEVGDGAEAVAGKQVTVQYVGVAYSNKQQFDASWDNGQPFTFDLGAGRVIDGWDQGVVGMKVGGRRELVIPPALGYGDRGAGGAIKPGETLVFVIDLLGVN